MLGPFGTGRDNPKDPSRTSSDSNVSDYSTTLLNELNKPLTRTPIPRQPRRCRTGFVLSVTRQCAACGADFDQVCQGQQVQHNGR